MRFGDSMVSFENNVNKIYECLLDNYSFQNWWPTTQFDESKLNINKNYYETNTQFSKEEIDQFEIIIGSILTQNTTWVSVDRALSNLLRFTDFNPINILNFIEDDPDLFKQQIKPTGYFNQKALYLKNIAEFYIAQNGEVPTRKEVLTVKGVGNETADSIMLYAYNQKEFVVDAYTKRIFSYLGYFKENATYHYVKKLFENNFEGTIDDYKEYHALIVNHAKNYYNKKPYGVKDKILNEFMVR